MCLSTYNSTHGLCINNIKINVILSEHRKPEEMAFESSGNIKCP